MKLLGVSNAKTIKGESLGYLTGILYLKPDDDLCPSSKAAGCKSPCLFSSGRGRFDSVKNARNRKTKQFKNDRKAFIQEISSDIQKLYFKAEKQGLKAAVRLNGTSDIDWTSLAVELFGHRYKNVMEAFPSIVFYDYTKRPDILRKAESIENYHVTFSYSGKSDYQPLLKKALKTSANIAAVFDTKKGEALPSEFLGRSVIDGDLHDLRFLDEKGVIVGLRAKGQARKDTPETRIFVVQA